MNCRICGNNQSNKEIKLKGTMYGTTGEYRYFRCGRCGCLQIEDMPDDIGAFYDTGKYYAFNMEKRKLKNKLLFLQMKNQVKHFDLLGKAVQMIYPVNYYFYNLITKSDALLDVGCGGGFPSVPLAIMFPDVKFVSADSIGKKITDRDVTIEELEAHALAHGDVKNNMSGRQEYLENIVNSILF